MGHKPVNGRRSSALLPVLQSRFYGSIPAFATNGRFGKGQKLPILQEEAASLCGGPRGGASNPGFGPPSVGWWAGARLKHANWAGGPVKDMNAAAPERLGRWGWLKT